jgi:hypothetical protein
MPATIIDKPRGIAYVFQRRVYRAVVAGRSALPGAGPRSPPASSAINDGYLARWALAVDSAKHPSPERLATAIAMTCSTAGTAPASCIDGLAPWTCNRTQRCWGTVVRRPPLVIILGRRHGRNPSTSRIWPRRHACRPYKGLAEQMRAQLAAEPAPPEPSQRRRERLPMYVEWPDSEWIDLYRWAGSEKWPPSDGIRGRSLGRTGGLSVVRTLLVGFAQWGPNLGAAVAVASPAPRSFTSARLAVPHR